ncbi:hypothetical protein FACS1894125_2850 [Actinomycetota bacterium]|nr:hypothetical protein FACS1894125_2850 [Actinomycetota bacterium]
MMSEIDEKMDALSFTIVEDVVRTLVEALKIPADEVMEKFYNSKTYEKLTDFSTGVWKFSTPTIVQVFDNEINTGKLEFPEEAI